MLAERLIREGGSDDTARLNHLFRLLACRDATDIEKVACLNLLKIMQDRYARAEKDAVSLLSTGEIARDIKLDVVEHAAWTQVVVIVLASDVAILLY
jgi:cytochrome c-type biogenesis protein CcmH/NrfG